jgi:hypothetical protein
MKARPILSLTLATALRTSVGALATNEAKSRRLGLVKLTADGLSDSVTLSRVQTHDKRFDVSPASALHNFVVASTRFGRSRETASPCALPNEWHDDSGNWFRSYGNENWEFDEKWANALEAWFHQRSANQGDGAEVSLGTRAPSRAQMSLHPTKNRTIGYRSEGFDPSLIHFCVFIDLRVLRPHKEISQ